RRRRRTTTLPPTAPTSSKAPNIAAHTAVPPSRALDSTPPGAAAAAIGVGSSSTGVTTPIGAGAGAVAGGAVAGGALGAATLFGATDATFGATFALGAAGLDTVGWATGVGRAVPALLECRKSSVTYTTPPLTITPMPTWLKPPSRMFSRWCSLFMKASWSEG